MTARLLASSPTVEGIQRLINRFWVSEHYRVDPETLALSHTTGRAVPAGAAVEKRGTRYRFVMTQVNA